MYLNSAGEDTLLLCDDCGYSANRQIATFQREEIVKEEAAALEEVETPGCTTIKELADFLKIPESKTAKAVFLMATVAGEDRFVFALLRGDHELNETKLANAVEATEMRPATEEEIRAIGSEPGYGSPVGVSDDAILVVDEFVAGASNLVSGANKVDHHYLNVNCGRDFEPNLVTDLVAVSEGMPCPTCGSTQRSVRGIEVGNIFKLGTKYTEALGVSVLDEESQARPVVMGSYGIGLGRLLACIIEEHHDDNGIIWPMSVAPFQVHIVVLSGNKPKGELEAAEGLSKDLEDQGIDVLVDDRDERAGVKFNDADLIGIPIRITVGSRGLANGQVEVKMRTEEDRQDVPLGDLVAFVKKAVAGADQAE
jgi:prolyl-tRNA synthetase